MSSYADKPHITYHSGCNSYRCKSPGVNAGWGNTPKKAYQRWKWWRDALLGIEVDLPGIFDDGQDPI